MKNDLKKIVLIIESLGSGGAERQLTGLAVLLKRAGYNVEVWYYIKKEFFLPLLQKNNVTVNYIPNAGRSFSRFSSIARQIVRSKPKVVISYSPYPSIVACVLRMLCGKFQLIVSERSITCAPSFRSNFRFFCYRWSDYVVPNSHTQKKYIDKHFPKLSAKVKVITNFVDTESFRPDEETILGDKTNMICVGTLHKPKNVLRFVDAIAYVVRNGYDLYVDWFGKDLADDYSKEIYEKVKNYGLQERIVFHSPTSNIHEEYNKADFFCLPSVYEGYPNVLCEAMSCGLPVICSKVSDIPEIIEEEENGFLFDPMDVNDIVKSIQRYLDLPPTIKDNMRKRSREIALERFSKDRFLREYVDIMS